MIAIIDYGVGNLFSLGCSFRAIGADVLVTSDPKDIRDAEKLVLPGVGAFKDAAKQLKESGLDLVIKEECAKGKILMGVCLGMQLLFDRSFEYGEWEGLSLIPGDIRPIAERIPEDLKIPHMGWNALSMKEHPLLKYLKDPSYVYFVHSYSAICPGEYVIATAEYGAELTAAVARGNVLGCQFHPEKSGETGLNILRAFCELKEGDLC
jgi:glutamine amidotransferase